MRDRVYRESTPIPNQSQICRELKKTFKASRKDKYSFSQLKTFKTVRDFADLADKNGGDKSIIATLRENTRIDRRYVTVKSITKSKRKTVDFHIPDGHSFNTNGIISHNTPYAELDLYGTIRNKRDIAVKDKDSGKVKRSFNFPVFEYPAIFPDGRLLFPQRHSFDSLMEKKDILGALIFSREILVKPISDGASIFPYKELNKAIKGQDEIDTVRNITQVDRKEIIKVGVGIDFAISSNIGADYTVMMIGGLDKYGTIHVFNMIRLHGANYKTQIAAAKKINRDFKPDIMFAEDNGMQEIFIQMMKDADLPIAGKTTTASNKKSLYKGVPRMAAFFESRKIKFPYKSQEAKNMTDLCFSELNSITFIPDTGKLESTNQHDDTSMAMWNLCKALKGDDMDFDFSFL